MSDKNEAAFLEAIWADPEDDTARLVYADWLDERGDPRGEFIRVSLELSQGVKDPERKRQVKRRKRRLYSDHGQEWTAAELGIDKAKVAQYGYRAMTVRGLPWFPVAVQCRRQPLSAMLRGAGLTWSEAETRTAVVSVLEDLYGIEDYVSTLLILRHNITDAQTARVALNALPKYMPADIPDLLALASWLRLGQVPQSGITVISSQLAGRHQLDIAGESMQFPTLELVRESSNRGGWIKVIEPTNWLAVFGTGMMILLRRRP